MMEHASLTVSSFTLYRFRDPEGRVMAEARRGASVDMLLAGFKEKLVEVREGRGNVFLDEGVEALWRLATAVDAATPFDSANAHIGVGDGTAEANSAQTGLQGVNKCYKPMDEGYPKVNGRRVEFRATFGPGEAAFEWNEWTVANGPGDDAANLNRKVESLGAKPSDETWILLVRLEIK